MAQLHHHFGAFLQHPAWIGGHFLGQKPKRSALGLVVRVRGRPGRQLGGDQDVIDTSHQVIGGAGAGHCDLLAPDDLGRRGQVDPAPPAARRAKAKLGAGEPVRVNRLSPLSLGMGAVMGRHRMLAAPAMASIMSGAMRRLRGQPPFGPSDVDAQSYVRRRRAISPPNAGQITGGSTRSIRRPHRPLPNPRTLTPGTRQRSVRSGQGNGCTGAATSRPEWCGRRDLNPHSRSRSRFSYHLGFRRRPAGKSGPFVVWTIPSPCPEAPRFRRRPSSLYTFPAGRQAWLGIGKAWHPSFPRI